MKVDVVLVTMRQRTEGRLADTKSMLDLTVDGLDGVDSVGEWLGASGAPLVRAGPAGCVGDHHTLTRMYRPASSRITTRRPKLTLKTHTLDRQ